ncbi:MAG: glycosyltransferase family 2 protein [Cytophagaceae bacterium]
MQVKKLSVIIPAFNEFATIYRLLVKVKNVNLIENIQKEIVIIDDFSIDDTAGEVLRFVDQNPEIEIKFLKQSFNQGKGAAVQKGIINATGDVIVIQDADLEYDPEEYNLMLKPIVDGYADAVYGSRFVGGKPHRVLFFFHSIGNKFLTFLSNIFTDLNLTDIETCYKMIRTDILKKLILQEKRFGFEPEVTAKLAKVPGIRIYEVGISYYGRTYSEGKKINWKDGFRALYCIVRYNVFD